MASQTALCDVNDLRYQMFRIKKGVVDSAQLPPCNGLRYPYASRYAVQLSNNLYGKYSLNHKKDTNSQEGHGWMIEDGQPLFDRMSDPLVLTELIVCKCNRMCKGPECQ